MQPWLNDDEPYGKKLGKLGWNLSSSYLFSCKHKAGFDLSDREPESTDLKKFAISKSCRDWCSVVHCHLHYDDIGRNSEELGEDIIEDEQGEPHRGLLQAKAIWIILGVNWNEQYIYIPNNDKGKYIEK